MEGEYVFSLFDIFPYYIVLIYMLVVYCGRQPRGIQAKFCFWAIFILAAIRYGVAYDYFNYKGIIILNGDEQERFEPFSRLLIEISRLTHYQVFFILGSFLTIYPIYRKCVKYSLDPSLSLILYYLYPSFYLDGLGIVRNAIAFSLVLCAFIYLLDDKKKMSVIFIICAAMFHKSSLVCFLMFPVLAYLRSKKIYLMMFVTSFLVSALIATVVAAYADKIMLLSNAQRYIEGGADRSGGGIMTFLVNGIGILNFLFWNRLKATHDKANAYLCSYTIGTCLWNVFLPLDVVMAGRFSTFFTLPLILIIPSYMYLFAERYEAVGKRLVISFFVLLFTSHFYINIRSYLEYPDKMSTIPYQTIFWYTDYNNLL